MFISVVIPTFNRAALLHDSITVLMNQTVAENVRFEVVFVSNGSTDKTEPLLEELSQQIGEKLRYFVIDQTGGPAAPRNRGIREAKGEVIIILDDDILPDHDLVQNHANYHARFPEPEAVAVGVAYVPDSMKEKPVSFFHQFSYEPLFNSDLIRYTYFWTCNISFKRDFMLQYGMFDENFLYNEDIICGHKLDRHGMQLRFVPEARGQHLHQLKLENLAEKGLYVGRWIWATTEHLPEPEVLDRYGVLSTRLGARRYMKRLINRGLFRLVDNPLVSFILRLMGAESGKRSRISDFYYYLLYRRNIVQGYKQARNAFRQSQKRGEAVEPTKFLRTMS